MDSGVARRPIADLAKYTRGLSGRLDPTANALDAIMERVRAEPKRVVFAEGEEEKIVRAAVAFRNAGYGTPVLIGREERVRATMASLGLGGADGIEVHNARLSQDNVEYTAFLYRRLQRRGFIERDCQRMVNQDRNVFAACMVATGHADAMVTGLTRAPAVCLDGILHVIDPEPDGCAFGLTLMLGLRGATIFIADTLMHVRPTAEQFADIACGAAATARRLGHEPRVALLSYSTFGSQTSEAGTALQEAVEVLDRRGVDFEYDGEMSPDVALDESPRALSVLPPDRPGQCADYAGAAFRPRHLAAGSKAGRGRHDRPVDPRPDARRPTGADGCHGQPDSGYRHHRGAPDHPALRAALSCAGRTAGASAPRRSVRRPRQCGAVIGQRRRRVGGRCGQFGDPFKQGAVQFLAARP